LHRILRFEMAKKPTVNLKQEKGRALKAENEAKKQAAADKQRAAAEAAEWQQGTNARKASREETASSKADEAARRRQEKAALLAEEESNAGVSGSTRKAPVNKKKGPKSELALLEDALQSAADKKVKLKRQDLHKTQDQASAKVSEPAPSIDPLLANTEKMIGLLDDELVGRQANRAKMQEGGASGIDAALASLSVGGAGGSTPVKFSKAMYNEFEARMLPVVKEESPGLRLSQYKELIWQLWKKSPENPANQVAS
jgi:membrane protein involved in colicin uptake